MHGCTNAVGAGCTGTELFGYLFLLARKEKVSRQMAKQMLDIALDGGLDLVAQLNYQNNGPVTNKTHSMPKKQKTVIYKLFGMLGAIFIMSFS